MTHFRVSIDKPTALLLKRARVAASSLWGHDVTTPELTAYLWREALDAPYVHALQQEPLVTISAGVPDGYSPDPVRLRSSLRWALPEFLANVEGC